MRALFISSFFIFIFSGVFSQDLEELCSLPDLSIVLDLYFDIGEPVSASTFYIKDSIYQSEKYLYYRSDFFGDFYLRIDDEKIFIKRDGLDKSESIAFDFGLEVSDKFQYQNNNGTYVNLEVVDVYTVTLLDGIERKAIDLVFASNGSLATTWIAGVGNKKYGYFSADGFQSLEMKCISSNSGSIFLEDDFSEEECFKRSCSRLNPSFQISENSFEKHIIIEPFDLEYDSLSLTFGDGIFFDQFIAEYDYEEPGCYLVELIYFDKCGNEYRRSAYYNYCTDNLYVNTLGHNIKTFAFTNQDDGIGILNSRPHYTTDGGATWDVASFPTVSLTFNPSFICPNLKGDKGLICISGNSGDYPRLLYTTDRGLNWEGIKDDGFYSRTAIASNGYLFIASNSVLRSIDEGETWEELNIQGSNSGNKYITISTENRLYVISQSSEYKVQQSSDYGNTWTTILESPNLISSVHFIDNNIGLVATKDKILRTEDGGESWTTVLQIYRGSRFDKFSFFDDKNGIVKYNKKIYRTTDSGKTWFVEYCDNVADIDNYVQVGVDDIYLIKAYQTFYKRFEDPDFECADTSTDINEVDDEILVYPNPASNAIFIKKAYSEGCRYLLSDVLGNKVMESEMGRNNQIDISTVAPGLYFISIYSNDKHLSNYPVVIIH